MKKTKSKRQPKAPACLPASPPARPPEICSDRAQPVLRFSPCAWAKLLFVRDRGRTEIGGFGVTDPDDLLYVEDVLTVRQSTTMASVAFDDEAVADFFDAQVDAGRKPEQFGRIWCHTHPGESPEPSCVDEETFERVFGGCQWAVMFIIGTTGKTHARLRFNVGPGGEALIPVEVDYSRVFAASDQDAWQAEYDRNIQSVRSTSHPGRSAFGLDAAEDEFGDTFGADACVDDVTMAEMAEMDADERAWVLAELGYGKGWPVGELGVLT